MVNIDYKVFKATVRTPRVACFIDINSEDWHQVIKTFIGAFTAIWGGNYFIIIPTDGNEISESFWSLLLAYDPDYLWNFNLNTFDSNLKSILKLRIAPFHFKDSIFEIRGLPLTDNSYPCTSLINILDNCDFPKELNNINGFDGIEQLVVYATTGFVNESFEKELKEKFDISINATNYKANKWKILKSVLGQKSYDKSLEKYPFLLSKIQLGFHRRIEFFENNEATIVIVGNTLEDFCLYYCLSRMRNKISWLSSEWLEEENKNDFDSNFSNFARSLRSLVDIFNSNSGTYLYSLSLDNTEISTISELLNSKLETFSISTEFQINETSKSNTKASLSNSIEFLLEHPIRTSEKDNLEREYTYPIVNGRTPAGIETPKPTSFKHIPPYHHFWITELKIDDYQPPRHPLLGSEMVTGIQTAGGKSGRITNDGIAYFSPNHSYYRQTTIDYNLAKPKIVLLNAFEIFSKLFQSLDYESNISDKGFYALDSLQKFGGLRAFARVLKSNWRKVLEKYLDKKGGKKGVDDEGSFLKDGRRYLDFKSINKIIGSEQKTTDLIDELIDRTVFYRGIILRCEFCKNVDWFNISELDKEFQCKRCIRKQVIKQFNYRTNEPLWYYKLDELVYQGLDHNYDVPILATNRIFEDANKANHFFNPELKYSTEIELKDKKTGKSKFELDICCIANGKLIIGEAKSTDSLKNADVKKYRELGEKLGVSKVVFATSSNSWKKETEQIINKEFGSSWVKVELMIQEDLY